MPPREQQFFTDSAPDGSGTKVIGPHRPACVVDLACSIKQRSPFGRWRIVRARRGPFDDPMPNLAWPTRRFYAGHEIREYDLPTSPRIRKTSLDAGLSLVQQIIVLAPHEQERADEPFPRGPPAAPAFCPWGDVMAYATCGRRSCRGRRGLRPRRQICNGTFTSPEPDTRRASSRKLHKVLCTLKRPGLYPIWQAGANLYRDQPTPQMAGELAPLPVTIKDSPAGTWPRSGERSGSSTGPSSRLYTPGALSHPPMETAVLLARLTNRGLQDHRGLHCPPRGLTAVSGNRRWRPGVSYWGCATSRPGRPCNLRGRDHGLAPSVASRMACFLPLAALSATVIRGSRQPPVTGCLWTAPETFLVVGAGRRLPAPLQLFPAVRPSRHVAPWSLVQAWAGRSAAAAAGGGLGGVLSRATVRGVEVPFDDDGVGRLPAVDGVRRRGVPPCAWTGPMAGDPDQSKAPPFSGGVLALRCCG